MNIFHEIWVAAGPYLIFCAVVLSPVVLGFIWICVRDCLLFGWIEGGRTHKDCRYTKNRLRVH